MVPFLAHSVGLNCVTSSSELEMSLEMLAYVGLSAIWNGSRTDQNFRPTFNCTV